MTTDTNRIGHPRMNWSARPLTEKNQASLDAYIAYSIMAFFAGYFFLEKSIHRDIFYVASLAPMIVYLHPWHLRRIAESRFWQLTAILSLITFAGIFWSTPLTGENVFDASRGIGAILIFLMGAVAVALAGRFDEETFFRLFALTALLTGLAALALSVETAILNGERLTSFGWGMAGPNYTGVIYAVSTVIAAAQAATSRAMAWKAVFAAAAIVSLACVVLSGSRASMLGIVIAGLILICFSANSRRAVLGLAIGGACVAAIVVALTLLGDLDPGRWIERGAANRLALWRLTIDQIGGALIFGHGSETELDAKSIGLDLTHPHNIVLATLFRTGIVGLVALLGLIGYAFAQGLKQAVQGKALGLALLGSGVTMMMLQAGKPIDTPNHLWLIFWLPVVLLVQGERSTVRAESDEDRTRGRARDGAQPVGRTTRGNAGP